MNAPPDDPAAGSAVPASLADAVDNWFERLEQRFPGGADAFVARGGDLAALTRLVACSEFAGGVMLRHWDWLLGSAGDGSLSTLPGSDELVAAFDELVADKGDRDSMLSGLRDIRNRSLLRILYADLIEDASVEEILVALSDLADHAVRAAVGFARRQLFARYGDLVRDGKPVPLVVVAMGKLGGRELNFSSDIDLVFLYPSDGETSGDRAVTAHEFFTRLVRRAVALLEEVTADGFVYRVDTRLRPFGDSGPPVVSFAGLESYLLQHGRSWERYAYVKARVILPDDEEGIASDLRAEIIDPFVYRRYLDYGVFESLREMKALIAAEVEKREMADNVKLGPGGIREIEFIVQSLQLVRGGSVSGLRSAELKSALKHAVGDRDMTRETGARLLEAYNFLRRIENRLQAVRDRQTHDLPSSAAERDRLAFAMRRPDWATLDADLAAVRGYVSDRFAAIALRDGGASDDVGERAAYLSLWSARADAAAWAEALDARSVTRPREVAEVMAGFAARPTTRRIDTVAAERLRQFLPAMLGLLPGRSEPATLLERVLNIVDRVLRRSAYLALLNENAAVLERLVELCESSGYLAREIAHFPALLDELIDARRYATAPDLAEMRADLERRILGADPDDSERQVEILGEFKRANVFRLAVADFSGSIPIMKVSDRLTDLAELILGRALQIARADLAVRYGEPRFDLDDRRHTAALGIIAYGKLGGMELSYGSDLDLVFLHDSRGGHQATDGAKPIDNGVYFARLARRLVHFLTIQTGSGALYEIDTRLRPSGRSGLLVTSIDAFERYQLENAWTWEHQALLRSRHVAGSSIVAREFERIRARTLRERVDRGALASDVVKMRRRMRGELDRSSDERFDIKQGRGGVADIEFLVQYLVMANAALHPAVIHYPDNIRQLGTLAAAGVLSEDVSRRLQEIYKRYRSRMHRLALDERKAHADAGEFTGERAFVSDLWRHTFVDVDAAGG